MASIHDAYAQMFAPQDSALRYPPMQPQPPNPNPPSILHPTPPPPPPAKSFCSNRDLLIMLAIGVLAVLVVDALVRKNSPSTSQ